MRPKQNRFLYKLDGRQYLVYSRKTGKWLGYTWKAYAGCWDLLSADKKTSGHTATRHKAGLILWHAARCRMDSKKRLGDFDSGIEKQEDPMHAFHAGLRWAQAVLAQPGTVPPRQFVRLAAKEARLYGGDDNRARFLDGVFAHVDGDGGIYGPGAPAYAAAIDAAGF